MIQQKKWSLLIFHLAMLIILAGAAITRYAGSEGRMHIREGDVSNEIISAESYLQFEATRNGKTYHIAEPVYFSSLGKNRFDESFQFGDDVYRFKLTGFIPNPTQEMIPDPNQPAVIKVVIAGGAGREEYYLRQGEKQDLHGTVFNFTGVPTPGAVNVTYQDNNLMFSAPFTLTQLVMATQTRDTILAGETKPLQVRALYSNGELNFVIGDFSPGARLVMQSSSPKLKSNPWLPYSWRQVMAKRHRPYMSTATMEWWGVPNRFVWEIPNSGFLTVRALNNYPLASSCTTS